MDTGKLSAHEAYRIAFETRNLEINLFWQRSNYFLVLTTALAVGFFSYQDKKYSLLLAFLGFIVSVLWYRVNLGSKYWQSRWEHRLKLVEEQVAPEIKFFAASEETIQSDVQDSLKDGTHKGLQKFLYRRALKKPSVSYHMILLSLAFVTAWGLLIVVKLLVWLCPSL